MENNLVGFRFSPTKEELINYYLKNKILYNYWLVNEPINEIDICAYDPKSLPSLSKLKSNDLEWYFFSLREPYAPEKKKKGTKRTTPNGFWKVTGKTQEIKDKKRNGVQIGIKKTLVYQQGRSANGVNTPWVMHEYHITCLPPTQSNYVICKVKYKGDEGDILYGNNSMVSVSNTAKVINTTPEVEQTREDHFRMSLDDLPTLMNEQDDVSPFDPDAFLNDNYCPYQQPSDDDYFSGCFAFNGGNLPGVLDDLYTVVQEDRNDHRPKKPLTRTLPDYSSESDNAESISATSYQGISSPESAHHLGSHFHNAVDEIPSLTKDSCKYTQTPAETSINRKTRKSHFTRRITPSKQEVKEGKSTAIDASMEKKSSSPMVKTEKIITEEAMDRRNPKNPRYIYLMNMIIGVIPLVAVIGNIICFFIKRQNLNLPDEV